MKGVKKSGKFFIMVCLAIIGMLFSGTSAFAHEIYYDGSTPISLRWNSLSSAGVIQIKMNGDNLNSSYSSHYSAVKSAWNTSAKVSVTQASFSSSNADLASLTQTSWDKKFNGYPNSVEVLGYCEATTTDNVVIKNKASAQASSRKIRYASLMYTPYSGELRNDTHRRLVMMHEVGHALGFGHSNGTFRPSSAASVMRKDTDGNYYVLQTHDINDLNDMYY